MTVIYSNEMMSAKVTNVFFLFVSEIHVAEVSVSVPCNMYVDASQTKIFQDTVYKIHIEIYNALCFAVNDANSLFASIEAMA